jgi:hypothetical protein
MHACNAGENTCILPDVMLRVCHRVDGCVAHLRVRRQPRRLGDGGHLQRIERQAVLRQPEVAHGVVVDRAGAVGDGHGQADHGALRRAYTSCHACIPQLSMRISDCSAMDGTRGGRSSPGEATAERSTRGLQGPCPRRPRYHTCAHVHAAVGFPFRNLNLNPSRRSGYGRTCA